MSRKASIFIGLTIAVGALFIADSLSRDSSFKNLAVYVCYFSLALLFSSMKVRLPGITGTISANFLFVLVATAVFSFSETVLLASAACIVQCTWKTKRRPKLLQVSFNVAALAISTGVSYRVAHLVAGAPDTSVMVLLAVATCFYFVTNTFLVSEVVALVESKSLMNVWRQCYLWSFPYYMVGAGIAALIVACGHGMEIGMPLLILPLMLMVHMYYRTCVERAVQVIR